MTNLQNETIQMLLELIQLQTGDNYFVTVVNKNKYTIDGISYNCDAQKTIKNLVINLRIIHENNNHLYNTNRID